LDTPRASISIVQLGYVAHRTRPSLLIGEVDALNRAAEAAQINTVDRWSMFLAQLAVESAGFTQFEENLSYSADGLLRTWPTRFTAATAQSMQHQPERIANRAYCDRLGNGDEASGEGYRYRGRGAIQTTGRQNYLAAGKALAVDLLAHPELLAGELRYDSAAVYWLANGLNHWADQRNVEDATRAINGPAMAGLADRKALFARAQDVLAGTR
jgi:putative chitinase